MEALEAGDDAHVWAAVCGGAPGDFGVIWDRHRDRVFRYLVGQGNDATHAEDLTAVVFLEMWRRRRAVRFVDGSAEAWLIATAKNVARNSSRSRRRHREMLAKIPPPRQEAAADAHIAAQSDLESVQAAAAARSATDARILELAADGTPLAVVADELQLTEAAVKMRLSRLRAHLRAHLAEADRT